MLRDRLRLIRSTFSKEGTVRQTAAIIVTCMISASTLAAQAPAGPPKPGPEHQKLGDFVGNWIFAGEMKPGPMGPGGKMSGTDRITWLPGNFFVERRFEGKGPMGSVSGVEIMGYDTAKKAYTYNFFDSMGMASSGTMTVSGNTWTFTGTGNMGGKTMHERCTLVMEAGHTTLKISCEMSPDGKKWAPMIEGTATKSK
jgi:hypothetical protein